MTESQLEGFRPAMPIGRYATSGELAAPTAFLLSSRAGDITGTRLHVNGGQSMV
ncbi:SDR family oxidoreductase [Rhodovulum sulfidophilum]|uniref:SDR family oxidoreductase n=1 Tax=Rhodovulum sulfidophilum TaxID=35806 RepID=UPI003B213630